MPASLLDRAVSHYGLTERQAGVVVAYCQSGSLLRACREVGYDYTEARRLLADNPGFQAAISEYIQGLYLADRVEARKVIVKLMKSGESERVRLDAAKWLDERAAGKAAEHHVHEHYVTSDREAIRVEIRRLQQELGLGQVLEVRALPIASPTLPQGEEPVEEAEVVEPSEEPPGLPERPA